MQSAKSAKKLKRCSYALMLVTCRIEIEEQYSQSVCTLDRSFGCYSSTSMWVAHGCRGKFRLLQLSRPLRCGVGGISGGLSERTNCSTDDANQPQQSIVYDLGTAKGRAKAGAERVRSLEITARELASQIVKLVINSYHASPNLPQLLHSLKAVGFNKWKDLIAMIAGAGEWAPRLSPLYTLADGFPADTVCTIGVGRSNLDLHGLDGLFTHRAHPLVAAAGYLYVLDSVTFDVSFPFLFSLLNFSNPRIIYTTPLPNSNIWAFGAGVVSAYGRSFSIQLSKAQQVTLEFNRGTIAGTRSLATFGEVALCEQRRTVYLPLSIARPRTVLFYPSFGLYKHILWGGPVSKCTAKVECTGNGPIGNRALRLANNTSMCPVPPDVIPASIAER